MCVYVCTCVCIGERMMRNEYLVSLLLEKTFFKIRSQAGLGPLVILP